MKLQRSPLVLSVMVALMLLAGPVTAQQSQGYDDITQTVANLRGLEILQPIDLTPLTREELRVEFETTLLDDYPEDERYADQREWAAFGLIPDDMDLGELVVDLYSEQVAGYYDPETGEMVVVRDGADQEGLTASEEVTYAHEVTHALQDQHFDIDAGPLDQENLRDDHSLAVDALVEGDASFTELEYLYAHPELLEAFFEELSTTEFDSSVLDSAPVILQETLLFPYTDGSVFVQALYEQGGWELVNSAYSNTPVSTEQILHPEKYIAGEMPVDVDVPDFTASLDGSWTIWDTNTFGEYQLRVILADTSLDEDQAAAAAAGWGGDTYVVAGTETDDAIHWVSVWDTELDAEEFARAWALRETERLDVSPLYAGANTIEFAGENESSRLVLEGNTVTYLMAPAADMLDTIATADAPASPEGTPAS